MTRPAIFADTDFDVALEESGRARSLLLVDATARWCGPCQVMDRTTWVDAGVIEALTGRATVIQVDVDAEQDVAKRLQIKAMPTIVAFKAGTETDRVTGLKKPAELLAWVEALGRGETALDTLRARAAANPGDMHLRMDVARTLAGARRLDEATTEYVWLWEHMLEHQPSMYGVRLSFLVGDLRQLIADHAPARDAVARLRAAVAPAASGTPDSERLVDWFRLNDALGEKSTSLAWFDGAKSGLERDEKLQRLLEDDIGTLLVEAGRWADFGALVAKPLAFLAQAVSIWAGAAERFGPDAPPGQAERVREHAERTLRATASRLVRGLRAAARIAEAEAVRDEAVRLDASAEMKEALGAAEAAGGGR